MTGEAADTMDIAFVRETMRYGKGTGEGGRGGETGKRGCMKRKTLDSYVEGGEVNCRTQGMTSIATTEFAAKEGPH